MAIPQTPISLEDPPNLYALSALGEVLQLRLRPPAAHELGKHRLVQLGVLRIAFPLVPQNTSYWESGNGCDPGFIDKAGFKGVI